MSVLDKNKIALIISLKDILKIYGFQISSYSEGQITYLTYCESNKGDSMSILIHSGKNVIRGDFYPAHSPLKLECYTQYPNAILSFVREHLCLDIPDINITNLI